MAVLVGLQIAAQSFRKDRGLRKALFMFWPRLYGTTRDRLRRVITTSLSRFGIHRDLIFTIQNLQNVSSPSPDSL